MASKVQRRAATAPAKTSNPLGNNFDCLPDSAVEELRAVSQPRTYAAGQVLFRQDEPAEGVLVIISGKVQLFLAGAHKTALQIALPDSLLGATSVLSGRPHELNAEALTEVTANLIPAADFRSFLERHTEPCLQVSRLLSRDVDRAYGQLRVVRSGCC